MIPLSLGDWLANPASILLVVLIWITPVLIALSELNKQPTAGAAKAVWTFVILIMPVIGAMIYLVFNWSSPGHR